MLPVIRRKLFSLLVLVASASPAFAGITIDFENLAVGAVVTTQYDGVTISAQPQPGSCAGLPPINAIIVDPAGTTSSGTKALGISPGCDFSPEYLQVVFDVGQSEVTFVLGGNTPPGTYEIRAFTNPVAGGEFAVPDVVIPAGTTGVNRFVRILRPAGDMRRIEIEDSIGEFEIIDDLTFESDNTPPTADIATPEFLACACGNVSVRGVACDSDGDYGFDKLEYRAVDADPLDPWEQIGTFSSPLCVEGQLYLWNTAAVAEGWYTLLLTVENANGLQSQDTTVVLVDKHFETASLGSPAGGAILGGVVCVGGTVTDHCFDHYFVEYRVVGGGAFAAVDPLNPQYNSPVISNGLASWNTTGLADGNYELRVRGVDSCGNTAESLRVVTIDNTAATAIIADPVACSHESGVVAIMGSATDAHFDRYELQYVGGAAADWTDIVPASVVPVAAGLLGNWDTAGLPRCAYLVRLVVHEDTIVDCCGGQRGKTYYLPVDLGLSCDLNSDGAANGLDTQAFVDCVMAGG